MPRAVVVTSGRPPRVEERPDLARGAGPGPDEALIDVTFSSVNYKDGMVLAGMPGVARADPLVPGIDVVGVVRALGADAGRADGGADRAARVRVGDRVVLNGAGIGETRDGGLAEQAIVPAAPLVRLPDTIDDALAAAIGTAGFTAMLSVMALERFVAPGDGDVVVTGANGGVGTVAIAILGALGYRVVASTGRPEHADALRALGAADVVDRAELASPGKPMQRARWAGGVDAVGGDTLANLLAQTSWGGAVTACGLAQGSDLDTTVMPFILRAVSLVGINSVDAPPALRERAWSRLARDLDPALLGERTTRIGLADAITTGALVLAGQVRGRTVVDVHA